MALQAETLCDIYDKHDGKVSDKWALYLREYERLFAPYRARPIRLLEIGIQNGGSLEIWSKYFPNAVAIIGCDINEDCRQLRFRSKRTSVVVGDANTDAVEEQIINLSTKFDIIIDDGSHRSSDIIKSFTRYFPYLKDQGLYVAEDLHCSYWSEFEGGLYAPHSSMSFFKRLADVVNFEHWGISSARLEVISKISQHYDLRLDDEILSSIHSLRFTNSMCAIEKGLPSQNELGERRLAGKVAAVSDQVFIFSDQALVSPDQSHNKYTAEPAQDCELEAKLIQAEKEIQQLRHTISAIEQSRTWRLTKPVRKTFSLFAGGRR